MSSCYTAVVVSGVVTEVLRLIDDLGLEDEIRAALRQRERTRIVHWTEIERKRALMALDQLADRGRR